jgi:hypothetical protein
MILKKVVDLGRCRLYAISTMKTYIVYLMGKEVGYIKARNHNQAEELAWKKFKGGPMTISVAYTEL